MAQESKVENTEVIQHSKVALINPKTRSIENCEAFFVFVHGLYVGNNGEQAWTNTTCTGKMTTSFPSLIHSSFPECCILKFSYPNSAFVGNDNRNKPMPLQLRGLNFLHLIFPYIDRNKKAPIFMIGHSMGGLVIKQAYIEALDKYYTIFNRIKTIVFYATPHRGSGWADMYKHTALEKILLPIVARGLRPTQAITDLRSKNNETLLHLTKQFNTIVSEISKIKILSFIEQQDQPELPVKDKVVKQFSAKLGLASSIETVVPLDYNHTEICQPKDKKDIRFTRLLYFLKNLPNIHYYNKKSDKNDNNNYHDKATINSNEEKTEHKHKTVDIYSWLSENRSLSVEIKTKIIEQGCKVSTLIELTANDIEQLMNQLNLSATEKPLLRKELRTLQQLANGNTDSHRKKNDYNDKNMENIQRY